MSQGLELQERLRRPLFNIDLYEPGVSNEDLVRKEEFRKCYREDEHGRIVALNLFQCGIGDGTALPALPALQHLNLGLNSIQDASFLREFSCLASLDLSLNDIQDYSFLRELSSLSSLDLSFNLTRDASFLRELSSLSSLNLRNNLIRNASFLSELSSLSSLDLSDNEIQDASFLRELSALSLLDLSNNKIRDYSFLRELSYLSSLMLRNNRIRDDKFLHGLSSLSSLDLSSNQILDASFLHGLSSLSSLDLSNNQIRDYWFMSGLSSLSSLDLSNTQILDASFLRELSSLSSLYLGHNQIHDWRFLRELSSLFTLDLSDNQIQDASFLRELSSLSSLNLRDNQIRDLSFLRELSSLSALYLSGNQIQDIAPLFALIPPDGGCPRLRTVDLSENQITDLPRQILQLGLELELGGELNWLPGSIRLFHNPIQNPPPEVLEQGHQAIIDWFAASGPDGSTTSAEDVPRPLNEAKILVVGEAGVGKTSIIKQLRGQPFNAAELKTHGIRRHTLDRTVDAEHSAWCGDVKVHVWDFGGQEIMHATHQFFLTKRSVYLLVLDSRKTEAQNRLEYWLRLIRNFGGESPVIVACNKCDEEPMDLDWDGLRAKFPEIKQFVRRLSCWIDPETQVDKREGIEALREQLGTVVARDLPLVQQPFPAAWRRVKDRLEDEAEVQNEMPRSRYEAICAGERVPEGSQRETLLQTLHSLGSILHFGSEHALIRQKYGGEETFVRNPGWVTAAVYRILNEATLKEQKGVLDTTQVPELLRDVEGDYRYDGREEFVVDLMEQFQLCFRFAGEERKVWIPDLSQKQAISAGEWPRERVFRYSYEVLPGSVMTRFLVKTHALLLGRDSFWRKGAILERNGIRALVTADEADGFLDIWLQTAPGGWSRERLDLFGIIAAALEEIHDSFQDRLGLQEYVPVPGQDDGFRELEELVEMKRDGETDVYIKGRGRMPIADLLPFARLDAQPFRPENLAPGGRREDPVTPNTSNLLFVSYAWSESEAKVTQLCAAAAERQMQFLRDKEEMRVGDSIRNFMTRLTQGERVAIFIGPAYLKSHYCVWELFGIWQHCGQDPEKFKRRIVPFIEPGMRLGDPAMKVQVQAEWMDKLKTLDNQRRRLTDESMKIAEELDRDWRWMRQFCEQIPNMLTFVQDKLMPRAFDEVAKDGFAGVWEMLEV